jgi:hypothetical protein
VALSILGVDDNRVSNDIGRRLVFVIGWMMLLGIWIPVVDMVSDLLVLVKDLGMLVFDVSTLGLWWFFLDTHSFEQAIFMLFLSIQFEHLVHGGGMELSGGAIQLRERCVFVCVLPSIEDRTKKGGLVAFRHDIYSLEKINHPLN